MHDLTTNEREQIANKLLNTLRDEGHPVTQEPDPDNPNVLQNVVHVPHEVFLRHSKFTPKGQDTKQIEKRRAATKTAKKSRQRNRK